MKKTYLGRYWGYRIVHQMSRHFAEDNQQQYQLNIPWFLSGNLNHMSLNNHQILTILSMLKMIIVLFHYHYLITRLPPIGIHSTLSSREVLSTRSG